MSSVYSDTGIVGLAIAFTNNTDDIMDYRIYCVTCHTTLGVWRLNGKDSLTTSNFGCYAANHILIWTETHGLFIYSYNVFSQQPLDDFQIAVILAAEGLS